MKNWKGTTGEWELKGKNSVGVKKSKQSICAVWLMDASHVEHKKKGESWLAMRDRTSKEREILHNTIPNENARLIADAGNTIQKCDLLPSELLERYNEAVNLIKGMKLSMQANPSFNPEGGEFFDFVESAEELIKKHESC